MVVLGATASPNWPEVEATAAEAGPKSAAPAGRRDTSSRAPAIGVELLVAWKTSVERPPHTRDDGPDTTRRPSVAGPATAHSHTTGPVALPARSATVTATVCTPAPRLPGAYRKWPPARVPHGVTSEPSTVTTSDEGSTPTPASATSNA